jgi:hypothetical protein
VLSRPASLGTRLIQTLYFKYLNPAPKTDCDGAGIEVRFANPAPTGMPLMAALEAVD